MEFVGFAVIIVVLFVVGRWLRTRGYVGRDGEDIGGDGDGDGGNGGD